jgi:hypothetical protein
MDLLAIGSCPPSWQARALASPDVVTAHAHVASQTEPNEKATLNATTISDPAAEQQRMLHFMSHINAECFISLLQIVDPMPDDYRARSAYKHRYRELRESLEIPLPPQDPQPRGSPPG